MLSCCSRYCHAQNDTWNGLLSEIMGIEANTKQFNANSNLAVGEI